MIPFRPWRWSVRRLSANLWPIIACAVIVDLLAIYALAQVGALR